MSSMPASPATVAAFVAACEPIGFENLLQSVVAVSNAHTGRGLADPTFGPASAELNRISGIGVPSSWKKAHWPAFMGLPYPLQVYVIERDKQDRLVVARSFNDAAKAKQELEEIKLKEAI
ncbi:MULTISPECIES: hypothetical protein [Bradyrhizobium]|uniref:hypothetical protein n=1 Tax=Bradyrhizobium TaxID=374 RepID=UPI00209F13FB|nr:hypothetical protein [Bradyrhizobium elkanii]MCP1969904.1 hypothetical protein [Bradyrhizobium elkanii]